MGNPLRLSPFELRLLTRREPPDRWLIDLASNDRSVDPSAEVLHRSKTSKTGSSLPSKYVPSSRRNAGNASVESSLSALTPGFRPIAGPRA